MSNIIPTAVCVLLCLEDRVLAVARKNDPSVFGLPGGKIDPGETALEAARRELLEETGYRLIDAKPIWIGKSRVNYCQAFIASVWQGPASDWVKDTTEAEVRWMYPLDLMQGPFGKINYQIFSAYDAQALKSTQTEANP